MPVTLHQKSTSDLQSLQCRGDNRLPTLDLIRGIAILGIFPANISTFGQSGFTSRLEGGADLFAMFTMMLVDGKIVNMLAILFGVGLAIQSDRSTALPMRIRQRFRLGLKGRRSGIPSFFVQFPSIRWTWIDKR